MIDWSTCVFPLIHEPISTGKLTKTDSSGELLWESNDLYHLSGSFDKRLSVKSVGGDGTGRATHLLVMGNPSKFLQGHNVFGSDDLIALNNAVYNSICSHFNFNPSPQDIDNVLKGHYEIGRTDINYSYTLPSQSDVIAWLRAAETKASTRMGRAENRKGSIYFGLTSEYYKLVIYSKSQELKTKRGELPLQLKDKGIEEWSENVLRAELRLLRKELKRLNIKTANDFMEYGVTRLFREYMGRIEMPEQIQLNDEALLKLPTKLRGTYTLWLDGHDLRNMHSPATFYRHKKELKKHGINIDLKPESTQKTNVIPLIKILEARPAQIPQWAFEQNLIHASAVNY